MQQGCNRRKRRLHANFIAALDYLDGENREPDRWEEECLSYALGAMACGMLLVAEVELDAFSRPANERSDLEVAKLEAKPQRFNKAMLRHGLDHVRERYAQSETVGIQSPPVHAMAQPDLRFGLPGSWR